jgi:nucleoside phosphorylase
MDPPPADTFHASLIYVKPLELMAITTMLDERFRSFPDPHNDLNTYILGRIGDHNVVIAGPARGDQGRVATAQLITSTRLKFPNITVGLLVGIGGGVPRYPEHDVRLGDVIVGAPESGPAVIQYDFGKRTADGFELTKSLPNPPAVLLKIVNKMQEASMYLEAGEEDAVERHLDRFSKWPRLAREYRKPSTPDQLFHQTYIHEPDTACTEHDKQFERIREPRILDGVTIHRSTILSGDTLMKSSKDRDLLSKRHNDALCFEMEAAGLINVFPCLVIRGISDYSDSHKNKSWQRYAAATAAAYAREVLLNMSKEVPHMPEMVKMAASAEGYPLASLQSHSHVVFSSPSNTGVQVGYNTGPMSNTFGRH